MKGFSDWYLLSIIPERVVSAQTHDILRRTIFFVAAVSLAIIMLALVYILQMKRTYHKLRTQAASYRPPLQRGTGRSSPDFQGYALSFYPD